ncbi:MAG: hypothetical protein P8L16_12200 [Ilumatobacter sp.]|nr:hypothetical protein [Ilumatobacter sp.]
MAVPLRNSAVSARRTPKPAEHRPALTLSPAPRRRWPAVLGSFALLAVLAGMLGAAVFHTQLAERQIRIGVLERSVNDERERFDELRHRRAELRSPVRLAAAADDLGMGPGDTGTFVELDPWQLARQLAAVGVVDDQSRDVIIDTDPLEQFSDVKRVSAGQP